MRLRKACKAMRRPAIPADILPSVAEPAISVSIAVIVWAVVNVNEIPEHKYPVQYPASPIKTGGGLQQPGYRNAVARRITS